MTPQGLSIRDVAMRFGKLAALDGVSLDVAPGEFLALLGPSGSGKTSLLRAIAGIAPPDAGAIHVEGQDFLAMTPRERRVGMVFQHYALFRHMTVADNIAFGLKVRPGRERPARGDIRDRVERLLEMVQLQGLGKRFPAQLSGGQRQRVALARALAIEPRMLLLDEPFGALDAQVRKELRIWLRELHDRTKVTTIFVTHDQEEAMQVADRVAVLRHGKIKQVGTPRDLDENPVSAFVFDFLGDANHAPCQVRDGAAWFDGFSAPIVNGPGAPGSAAAWFRPHDTGLARDGEGPDVIVVSIAARGAILSLECRDATGRRFQVDHPRGGSAPAFAVGDGAKLQPRQVWVFDQASPV